MIDSELAALVEQAARNLESLELLARGAAERDRSRLEELRQRLHELQLAYIRETDSLTQHILSRAVERRMVADRRERERREGLVRRRTPGPVEIAHDV